MQLFSKAQYYGYIHQVRLTLPPDNGLYLTIVLRISLEVSCNSVGDLLQLVPNYCISYEPGLHPFLPLKEPHVKIQAWVKWEVMGQLKQMTWESELHYYDIYFFLLYLLKSDFKWTTAMMT